MANATSTVTVGAGSGSVIVTVYNEAVLYDAVIIYNGPTATATSTLTVSAGVGGVLMDDSTALMDDLVVVMDSRCRNIDPDSFRTVTHGILVPRRGSGAFQAWLVPVAGVNRGCQGRPRRAPHQPW